MIADAIMDYIDGMGPLHEETVIMAMAADYGASREEIEDAFDILFLEDRVNFWKDGQVGMMEALRWSSPTSARRTTSA